MKWAYGVTGVPSRATSLLPRTLASLAKAGFDKPRLFIDGAEDCQPFRRFNLPVTLRFPKIGAFGNWALALAELYLREPEADRYALFQDDIVVCRRLRAFLEQSPYPANGYQNLYTWPVNEKLCRGKGWWPSNQRGLGAQGVVFSRPAAELLLRHPHLAVHRKHPSRGLYFIDGCVVTAFRQAGWKEYVHSPSLVQHTGMKSLLRTKGTIPLARTFPGEDCDALSLL